LNGRNAKLIGERDTDVLLKVKIPVYVHGSVHRNNILVHKSQQDAHVTEFIFV